MKLTQKRIGFVHDVFKEVPPSAAYMSHYHVKTKAVAASCAHTLLKNTDIQAYLQELRDKAQSDAVMNRQEILERHSVIGRTSITDFQTAGADGSWIDIGPENKHSGAIQEITSRTEYDKDGSNPAVITKVKLHDPVRSMQEIAKLQGYYPEEKGSPINIDNRIINITVNSEKGKEHLDKLKSGKLPELDNATE